MAGTVLRLEMDRVPLWRGDHVSVKQLVEDFASYLNLPRLADPSVLLNAVRDGVALLSWEQDSFAFADSYDEAEGRYRGLRAALQVSLPDADAPGLLVKPAVARRQLEEEAAKRAGETAAAVVTGEEQLGGSGDMAARPERPAPAPPKRFHGTVALDPARVGRDASVIADEVIAHLAGLVGAKVQVTLEIEAEIPNGAPEQVVRTVTENSVTLKFKSHGFERE